jgi:uncharacterized membrane protein YfcA
LELILVLAAGILAGTVSGIVGTGASLILMPILVVAFGPQQAVPIMAIAAVFGNVGKVLAWWRVVDWRACGAYSATAVPCAVLGVKTLLAVPPQAVEVALGAFFIAMVPARRWFHRQRLHLSYRDLALVGAPVGFLTGIVVSTGPIQVPIFIGAGLEKGAFIATEAAASFIIYLAKVLTFSAANALPADILLKGLAVGGSMMAGAFVSRRILQRISSQDFRHLIDALMIASGLSMFWVAFR